MGTFLEPPVFEVEFDGTKMTFKQVEYLRGIELHIANAHPDKFVLIENENGEYEYSLNLLMKLYSIGYTHLVSSIIKAVQSEQKKGNKFLFFPGYNEN